MGIVSFIIAIIFAVVLFKLVLGLSITVLGILVNSLVGAVIIGILNLFKLNIPINWLTALLVGCFGVPGVIAVLVLKYAFTSV